MVHVALAGGSGNVGREIVAELVAQGKHQVTVLSRNGAPKLSAEGITVVKVNYLDNTDLTVALQGVHTVLSFLTGDPENAGQKALIAACIEAGVKRFAPSEWAAVSNSGMPGYAYKDDIHAYLKELNAEKTVLEYSLFQTGIFMNYLVYPKVTAKHLFITCIGFDTQAGQALMVEDGEEQRAWTTVQDVAKVVAAAIDYEGKWPEVGGMVGSKLKQKDLIKLLEKYSGKKLTVHKLKKEDLAEKKLNSDWIPPISHPNMPPMMSTPEFKKTILCWFELAATNGCADVAPVWNELLPEFKFTDIETFLAKNLGGE